MSKNTKIFLFLLLILFLSSTQPSEASIFKKKKSKTKIEKPKMVVTKQEWEQQAISIPLEARKIEKTELKSDKKNYIPKQHYILEKYNYPQGKRQVNIATIKKNLIEYPYMTADLTFKYIAYPIYYYNPATNQISSNFYVEKLPTGMTRINKILNYNHKQAARTPIIEAGTNELYSNLYDGLTLVDWSNDSKKILIEEKIGSAYGGIYKTYLYIHYLPTDIESGKTIKLSSFDNDIKHYFLDFKNIQIVKYRYSIEPLGFSADNDDIIYAHCFIYDSNNEKIFAGTFGYNLKENRTFLQSDTNPSVPVSTNGLTVRPVIE